MRNPLAILRPSRLIRCIGKLLSLTVFWVALVLIVVGCIAYYRLHPVVERVPMATPGGDIALQGRGFGDRQEDSYLVFEREAERAEVREVTTWSMQRIVTRLPEAMVAGGRVRVIRRLPWVDWPSQPAAFVVQAEGLPSRPYGYEVPVPAESPWPLFRRDHRNTGRTPIRAAYHGDQPWSYRTGKGIFSTPVIGADGVVYVGSADHWFYALNPDGTLKWRFKTGGIVDSAAALHRADKTGTVPSRSGTRSLGTVPVSAPAVTFISGDGLMYHLRTDGDFAEAAGRVLWTFDASSAPGAGYIDWWEGNVAMGFDGTLYAGNTNWNYYAVHPDGTVKWQYATGNNNWSMAAFGDDGVTFWGSLDTKARAVTVDGVERWAKRTLGPIAASAALGSDGTVYIASFDSYLYALDPDSGRTKWKFKTTDHIYSSAALACDAAGATSAIYFGSADGMLYALIPKGALLWKYDVGDPIRSSPAIGRAPEGEQGDIVYFGAGNGKLYALNAADGTRRWSFDTTPEDPELRERNDLNASPALGQTGVYVAGEHGYVWYVPYDYPLHAADPRCSTDPLEDLPEDAAGLHYVTPGGTTLSQAPETIPTATILTFRLVVREDGATIDARMKAKTLGVRISPPIACHVETSADGHYVHIVPDGFLDPDATYAITVKGDYYTGGIDVGNLTLAGRQGGHFYETFTFRTPAGSAPMPPLAVAENEVSAVEWTRLAVPVPSMIPSLNQIGFDYLDCIIAAVEVQEPGEDARGKFIAWMTGAQRDDNGVLTAAPEPDFMTPLNGRYQGDCVILRNCDFKLKAMGVDIPFDLLDLRGQLGPDGRVQPGATAYAETEALAIPDFGPLLVLAGLANDVYKKLVVAGTFITRPYDDNGQANRRPDGVSVASVDYAAPSEEQAGRVVAHIKLAPGASYPLDQHCPALFLVDADRTEAVFLDYYDHLATTADPDGNLASITLDIPPKTILPPHVKAVVMLDAFPLHQQVLTPETH